MNPEINKPIAIFDIDGTIFRKNLQFELLEGLSWEGVFPKEARSEIVRYYRAWLENRGSYGDYREHLVKLYKEKIRGCSQESVLKVAKGVANFHHGRLFLYTSKLFSQLKKTHYLIAISGSPVEIVHEFNRHIGFDRAYGTVFETNNGLYTGEEQFVPVRDKSIIIQDLISEGFSLKNSYGVGDTEFDVSFLEKVEHPIAFNPDQILKNEAEKKKWRIVVERKDVVYEIQ